MTLAPPGSEARAPPRRAVHRLFFALWPDAALRRRIDATTAQLAAAQGIRGRRLRPQRYHLTLRFLGDFDPLPEAVIDAAMVAADEVRVAAFDLRLDRAGSFGGRVGWLGPAGLPPGLHALWAALGLALDRHGLAYESDAGARSSAGPAWTPHVTVMRGMRPVLAGSDITPLPWPVDRFVLIRSQPGDAGCTVLGRWTLGTAGHGERVNGARDTAARE